jgi:hypothetical protein
MSEPFNLVSVADFERMTRAEKEKYIEALIAHLQTLRTAPIGEALRLSGDERSGSDSGPSDSGVA